MVFCSKEAKANTRTKWQKVAADPRETSGYLGKVTQTLSFPNAPEVDIDGLMEKAFTQADYAVNTKAGAAPPLTVFNTTARKKIKHGVVKNAGRK